MASNPTNVKHGTCNGATISPDMSRLDPSTTKRVKLKFAYTVVAVPGAPSRPGNTGVAAGSLDFPRTIPANTVLTLLPHEAAALVAANCATYSA